MTSDMLSVLFRIFNFRKEYLPSYEKENAFHRIAPIIGFGALILAPLLALIFYFSGAPLLYVYMSLSYALAFPVYYFTAQKIYYFRDKLIYFYFCHLFVLSFIAFYRMNQHNFVYESFYYFICFYILSVIIIQRLYPAVLYQLFIALLFIISYYSNTYAPIHLSTFLPMFILFGLSDILMIYVRSKMIHNIEDYSDYLKKIMNNPGSGYILFDINKKARIIDYNEEAAGYFVIDNRAELSFQDEFFDSFNEDELSQLSALKIGTRFIKNISVERFKRKADIEIKIGLISLKNSIYWLAHLNDVTVQNKKRLELEISERKYRNLYHKNKAGVFTIDKESKIVDGNESFFKMFENTLVMGDQLFSSIEKEDWKIVLETLKMNGSIQNYQTQFYLSNGVCKTFIFSWYLDPQSGNIEGSVIDLTHIQKTAQALRQSEQKYRLIFEGSNDAILLLKGDHIIDANKKALQLFNKNNEEIKNIELFDLSWKRDPENLKIYREYKSILAKKRTIKFNWLLSVNKEKIEVEIVLSEIMLENQLYYQCVIHDLTEQKKLAEEKLRAEFAEETNVRLEAEIKERIKAERKLQEQFLRTKAILDSSANTFLITLSLNNKITSFNSHCEDYFLHIFNNRISIGTIFTDFFKNNVSESHLRLFKRYLSEVALGRSRQVEFSLVSGKGNVYWMEVFISPIFDTEGRVAEISLVAHDISEKKKSSIEIVESLKEKEVLLKEIHHRVKNNLQVISSILNLQSSFVEDQKTLSILQESRNRIRSMAIIHENLYKTKDFSTIKFDEYLDNLSKNLVSSYRITGDIQLITDIKEVDLILDQAIPCGLLVNEIVTNALKYAWDDEEERIIVLSLCQTGKRVTIEISDNGKGLPNEFNEMNSDTLGLQLIMTLSEQLDGELTVDRQNGTKYLLTFDNIKPLSDVQD